MATRYKTIQMVGEGSFGWVYKVWDNFTGQIVAVKVMKQSSDPAATLMEVRALIQLKNPHIVSLMRVEHQDKTDFLIFEYMESSLGALITDRRNRRIPFSEAEIRSFSFQVLQGLEFMHQRGYMHRDLKPDNLLVNKGVIKISDLGSATKLDDDERFQHYVTTRWYRAPEMLLRTFVKNEELQFEFDEKVDMWAIGAIIAELFCMCPLFMGDSSRHQLYKICQVIGAPTWDSWRGGVFMINTMNWPELGPEKGVGMRALMPYASEEAIDLMESLCSWDPWQRPSAKEALQHPFFKRRQIVKAPPGFSYCNRTMNTMVPRPSLPMLEFI